MAMPRKALAGTDEEKRPIPAPIKEGAEQRKGLVAESGTDRNAAAADGATAAENGCAGLGLHARPEAVCFHAVAAVGLKCALGHGIALLFPGENLCLDCKIQVYRRLSQEASKKRRKPQNRLVYDEPEGKL